MKNLTPAAANNRIYVHTFGCKVNQYESQVLLENCRKNGYELTGSMKEAGTLLINSCTVTGEADRQCRQLIRKVLRDNPGMKIIVSGCYAVRLPEEIAAISPSVKILEKESPLRGDFGITRFEGHSRAFVKIQDGCDAYCSYCIVPYVRSKIISRPQQNIISEINGLLANGYTEIVLTGVRLGKYDGGLENLINGILKDGREFRIRLSSLEINEVTEGLLRLMKDNPRRICRHLHFPLQSGSDGILEKMKRPYTAEEFIGRTGVIRAALPDAGVTTDIIVGFPGETDRDFKETYAVAEKLKFSKLHVFKYSKREGTEAYSFKNEVGLEEIKERSRSLRDLDIKLQAAFVTKWLGTVRPAVFEGTKNTLLTDNYIRLGTDLKYTSFYNNIIDVEITELAGRPWGVAREI